MTRAAGDLSFLEITDGHIALVHPNHMSPLAIACGINVPMGLYVRIEVRVRGYGAQGHCARAVTFQRVRSFQFLPTDLSATARRLLAGEFACAVKNENTVMRALHSGLQCFNETSPGKHIL